jgi:cytidyltransferase-like protein
MGNASISRARIGFSAVPDGGALRDIGLGQVVSQRELILRRGEWKRTGKGVVCAYGAFDLLHPGHIRLLEQARDFGEILVVAIQSDSQVRAASARARDSEVSADAPLDRPITPATERAEIVASLSAVDFASVIDVPAVEFLSKLRPEVFVLGDEKNARSSPSNAGAAAFQDEALAALGCELVRLPLEPGYSTSRLIERISENRA